MTTVAPAPVGGLSKAEATYEAIRAGIVDGTFPPGSRLVLDQLARDLSVSPVPVREAVRRLEAEGYVTFRRNLGATVATIDAHAYGESMQTLAVLEAAATAFAVPVLRRHDLRQARKLNAEMAASLRNLDPVAFTERNHEFHRVLYFPCANGHLLDLIEREWTRLAVIRRSTFAFIPERAGEAVVEHAELLRRIETGQPVEEVEAFARAHRTRTADAYLDRRARVAT